MDLRYFKATEFGPWWPLMDPELVRGLDEFRHRVGQPVIISPAAGALGRPGAGDSQHNHLRWGLVRAADVMVPNAMPADLNRLYEIAVSVGVFSGIGLYRDWRPWPGLHLDTRVDRKPARPATWAGLATSDGQTYVGIERAWA